jgi:starch phosphorylase
MRNSDLFKRWETFHKGLDSLSLQISLANHLEYSLSKDQYTATVRDLYHSLALTVRDRLIERWIRTQQTYYDRDARMIFYLSAEYLMGRALVNNLINLDIYQETAKALNELNLDLEGLIREEPDAGLGNGGLGRLAACFLDSLATSELPALGYGIRYEFGIFEQFIRNFRQEEHPDEWLKFGNPWEIQRPERSYSVRFYGRVVEGTGPGGRFESKWVDAEEVVGLAYDTPIDGYDNNTVNTLRLWSARAAKNFDLAYFQHGDYLKAVEEKNESENISKVLYPNDNIYKGQELRLKQQYFFVSCSIQDIIRRYQVNHRDFDRFADKVVIQLNDTHPSLAIVELMRIFLDDYGMEWERAWDLTSRVFAYTNHTILAEALERWPVTMLERLLPRHLRIIYEINRRFLREASLFSCGRDGCLERVSLIEEGPEKKVRMANLAILGSRRVNGVSALHSRILAEQVFPDFTRMAPEKFTNVTNGITPRRWLLAANPGLSSLISGKIGQGWVKDLARLRELEPFAADPEFRRAFREVKRRNKEALAAQVRALTGIEVDAGSMFVVQVKRIHEYKRQLLNILYVISEWLRLKGGAGPETVPRTFLFAGTAAPSYRAAKQILQLICMAADMINRDPSTRDHLQVVFMPNYRVSLAEAIIPAADLSVQISTAGFEASGTGNMKLALNGALTVGTLDGANIELREEVGPENFFLFGLTAGEVAELRTSYDPGAVYRQDPLLRETVDLVRGGFFSPEERDLFLPLMESLLSTDRYFTLTDFDPYRDVQRQVNHAWLRPEEWDRMAVLNVARCGKFSSDRTIQEYNRAIWQAETMPISRRSGPDR